MLTFEQKLSIFDSFPQLERRDVSLGRVNYHYEQSVYDKKTVVYRLHPNGNGYVYAGLLEGYEVDPKGFVNIRDYDEEKLRDLVEKSVSSLSVNENMERNSRDASSESPQPSLNIQTQGGVWVNANGEQLTLKYEDDLWYIYSGISIEMVFETREEAGEYLAEEGFNPQK
ncbi:hypothetical protein [Fontibacillus panacisegetis]|nr:hypothetical protein [Fontibacillus solani]